MTDRCHRLRRSFFDRPCVDVARNLVGTRLVHDMPSGPQYVARIVEVEAYVGDGSDPAAHGHGGITPRTRAMYGPPGHIYVYRAYGIHTCLNVVTEAEGRCAAVLIRAVEPRAGVEQMQENRGGRTGPELTNGPGKVTQAMQISLAHYGACVETGPVYFLPRSGDVPRIGISSRIGIRRARDLPYRFFEIDNPWVGSPARLR